MSTFTVIDLLETTPDGPVAHLADGTEQAVFLRQGDADGACGPYSLLIALLICGVIQRDNITFFVEADRRTNYGKLMAALAEHPGLFRDGTDLDQLVSVIAPIFRRQLGHEASYAAGVGLRRFVQQHIEANKPVIIGLSFSNGGHWLVVIGIEYDTDANPRRLLLLDPSGPRPAACPWNGVIDLQAGKGRYPYSYWWPGDHAPEQVSLREALALWPLER